MQVKAYLDAQQAVEDAAAAEWGPAQSRASWAECVAQCYCLGRRRRRLRAACSHARPACEALLPGMIQGACSAEEDEDGEVRPAVKRRKQAFGVCQLSEPLAELLQRDVLPRQRVGLLPPP